jgi:hypothetical protein
MSMTAARRRKDMTNEAPLAREAGMSIKTDFDGLKRMAREFTYSMPTLDYEELENGMKAFGLAYIGCDYPDDIIGRANLEAGAPALLRIVQRAYMQRLIDLDAALAQGEKT